MRCTAFPLLFHTQDNDNGNNSEGYQDTLRKMTGCNRAWPLSVTRPLFVVCTTLEPMHIIEKQNQFCTYWMIDRACYFSGLLSCFLPPFSYYQKKGKWKHFFFVCLKMCALHFSSDNKKTQCSYTIIYYCALSAKAMFSIMGFKLLLVPSAFSFFTFLSRQNRKSISLQYQQWSGKTLFRVKGKIMESE